MSRSTLVSALTVGLILAAAGCGEAPKPDPVRPLVSMKVADASGLDRRTFTGRARATNEVNVAFEVSGRMIERPVDVGSVVKQGDLLARVDPRDFENSLAAAVAARQRAEALYERVAQARASGAVSAQELTDAKASFDAADATVRIREKALEDTRIVAPFDGTIAATYVENYQNVRPKQRIMRLLDTSRIELIVDIPEGLISMVPYVENLKVRFDAFPEHEIPARIKEVGTEASATTRTYPVTLIMDQPDDVTVLAGMAGRASGAARLPADLEQSGVEVPVAAVFTPPDGDGQSSFVWVVEEPALTVKRRQVETLRTSALGVRVQGLEPGERIAIAGVHYLREGQQVRLYE
ncbi:MAG: efflux RND transporter periplasmic adaptor subunit [Myxococcota bacterium]|nr:efflux RND transporter periplasmic adaptor subunit [Myxococcota bacterium]